MLDTPHVHRDQSGYIIWSPELRAYCASAWWRGALPSELAADLGITPALVSVTAGRLGWKRETRSSPKRAVVIPAPPIVTRKKSITAQVVWTDELDGWIEVAWKVGLSTSDIAYRLGVSKNTIIGRIHRMHLEGRPSPIRKPGNATNPARPPILRAPRQTLPPMARAPVETITQKSRAEIPDNANRMAGPISPAIARRSVNPPAAKGLDQKPRKTRRLDPDLIREEIASAADETVQVLRRNVRPIETVEPRAAAPFGWPARVSNRCQMPRGESVLNARVCAEPTFAGCYCKEHAAIVYRGAAA